MTTKLTAYPATIVKIWAGIGAVWIALIAYIVGSWLIGPYLVANVVGREDAPDWYVALVRGMEVFSIVATLLVVSVFIVRPLIRTGRFSWDGLFFMAAFTLNIQESWLNYQQIQLNYSTVFINLGSWNLYTPGWNAPYPERTPYALVALAPSYMWLLAFVSLLLSKLMRWIRANKRDISHLQLIGLMFAICCLWCLFHETILLRTGLVRYGSVVPELTAFAGKDYQYPLYEMASWAACFLVLACLRFYRDDKGLSFVEKGADQLALSAPAKTFIRWLALVGFMQTAMLVVYNAPMNYWGTQVTTLKEMPQYLRADMCGPRTNFDCPDYSVPMARKGNKTNRIGPNIVE